MKTDFKKLARIAAQVMDDKKTLDVVILDLGGGSDITDFWIIGTAESSAQMSAVQDAVVIELKKKYQVRPIHQDGYPKARWIAIDYGGMVVHIFLRDAREHYRLESLWEKAKKVPWKTEAARPRAKAART